MTTIGIMQGRLVPPLNDAIQAFPRDRWEDEFGLAAAAQLGCIEWIYDVSGEDVNPLGTGDGIRRMQELSARHGVTIRSLCADYFMDRPLIRATESESAQRLEKLAWLLERGHGLGIRRIVLPFVDQSAITTPADGACVVAALRHVLPLAERLNMELHLETALGPEAFRALLDRVQHPLVQVNYDSGNSASLGYRPDHEFAAYGCRIGSVHVKDRQRGGGTVALGSGDADLPAVFAGLKALGYQGEVILQVARGAAGDEVAWASTNRAFVERHWRTAG